MLLNQVILNRAFLTMWDVKSSNSPAWTRGNPPLGQCAVTALIVQDYLGGDLLRCVVNKPNKASLKGQTVTQISHYFNLLPDGIHLDLTWDQFGGLDKNRYSGKPEIREREYVLSFKETLDRYEYLKEKIEHYLKVHGY
jgi:hypothetical protein